MDPQAQQQAVHFSNNNNNNNNSNNSNGGSNNTQQSPPPQLQQQQYSLPGVLHFLQVEWRRFERERNEWELERADMKARLSFLEGERRGMENSKADLMRRVKMLEFALRQERGKYLSLQNATKGAVPSSSDTSETKMNTTFSPSQSPEPEQPSDSGGLNGAPHVPSYTPGPLMMYSKGVGNIRTRELLKNYLREANYLLAHSGYSGSTPSPRFPNRQPSDTSIANDPVISKRSSKNVLVEEVLQPSSNSVVVREESNNPPKASAPVQILKRAPSSEEFPSVGSNPSPSPNTDAGRKRRTPSKQRKGSIQAGPADFMDQDSGVPTVPEASAEVASVEDEETRDSNVLAPRQSSASFVPDNDDQVIWRPKASLRSHLDSVRSVAFLPSNDLALVSGSEDGTAKLWNIRSLQSSRKTPSDIEPVYTFRGHNSGVTSVALSPDGQSLYTGSLDSTIIAWRIPNVTRETYSATDNSTLHQNLFRLDCQAVGCS
ncbi:Striatin family-domain-containing protein [Zopfochytrium polystomum]|nr:Striatin family-domain-containing protein [Zopfochytrium polystomum]